MEPAPPPQPLEYEDARLLHPTLRTAGSRHRKGLYVDEVIAVQLTWEDEPVIERLGYVPNRRTHYLSEPFGAVSFDGRKFCAGANWGDADGQVQAYVVDITDLCRS